jgi:hypothetical protein
VHANRIEERRDGLPGDARQLLVVVGTHSLIFPTGMLEVSKGLCRLGHTMLLALAALLVCATFLTGSDGIALSDDAQLVSMGKYFYITLPIPLREMSVLSAVGAADMEIVQHYSPNLALIPDIPHCLIHFCEYSAVKSFIRFSKEFEQLLMLLGQIQH